MSPSNESFDSALAAALRADMEPPPDLAPVLRRARRRLAALNVFSLVLGRIWLALAWLLAPLAARLHRLALDPSRQLFR